MFRSFRSRITRGYVFLAIALILLVVATSSALALLLYAGGLKDSIGGASARASDAASRAMQGGRTLEQAAPEIISSIGHSRFHVLVLDSHGRPIAQNEREGPPSAGRAIVIAIGRAIGLPRTRIPVAGGGEISISADFDRFGELLLWYWSIMIPLGIVAVLAAWLIARRITSRAVGPLGDVTQALRTIAEGDFSPERLLNENTDIGDLTQAYNDVAYALATATSERVQTEAQMRQFIADAGHELRTPLTIIMGYLDVLRQGIVQDSDGTQRTYETMLDESRKMRALIDKLILLARLDRSPGGRPAPTDLTAVVRKAAESLAPISLGRVHADLREEGAIVEIDEAEIYEAVKNVIENALKYAPQSQVDVRVTRNDEEACVSVSDRGPGMEPQDVQHAFDRFYRGAARGEIEGSGLGLAIAKRAAERAGGHAAIESSLGRGTRVVLCFPRLGTAPHAATLGEPK